MDFCLRKAAADDRYWQLEVKDKIVQTKNGLRNKRDTEAPIHGPMVREPIPAIAGGGIAHGSRHGGDREEGEPAPQGQGMDGLSRNQRRRLNRDANQGGARIPPPADLQQGGQQQPQHQQNQGGKNHGGKGKGGKNQGGKNQGGKNQGGKGQGKNTGGKGKGVCFSWRDTGTCRRGNNCPFSHE